MSRRRRRRISDTETPFMTRALAFTIAAGLMFGGLSYVLQPTSEPSNTPTVNIQGSHLKAEVCFSPEGKCLKSILRALRGAKRRIWLQGYSFTSKPIAEALIEAKGRGLDVQVLLDKSQETAGHSVLPMLIDGNIPVWIDAKLAIAHNKIILIDEDTLFTGSYNWNQAAESRNAENLLFIHGKQLFTDYEQNFVYRKSLSREIKNH